MRSRWCYTLDGRFLHEDWLTAGPGDGAVPIAEALFAVAGSGPGDFVAAYKSGQLAFGESAFSDSAWTLTHRRLREPGTAIIRLRFLDANTYAQEVAEITPDGRQRFESVAVMKRERRSEPRHAADLLRLPLMPDVGLVRNNEAHHEAIRMQGHQQGRMSMPLTTLRRPAGPMSQRSSSHRSVWFFLGAAVAAGVCLASVLPPRPVHWPAPGPGRFEPHWRTEIYPVIRPFLPRAGGTWEADRIPTLRGMGGEPFDDRARFYRACRGTSIYAGLPDSQSALPETASARASGLAPGGAWVRHAVDTVSAGADGVKLADANGDGLMDVTTGWEEGGIIRVCFNPGPAGVRAPWPAVTVGRVRSPEDAAWADLDGDGALDVLSATEGNERTVYVHWAPRDSARRQDAAAWTTAPLPMTQSQQMWMFLLPLDLDRKAGVDVVTGSKGQAAAIGWLRAPANARDLAAWTWHPLRPAGWIMSLRSVDLDGDGDTDIVYSDRKGERRGMGWLENPGPEETARSGPWRDHPLAAQHREVMFLDVGDLDGDGRLDLAAAVKPAQVLLLRRTPDAGWREEWVDVRADCGTAKAVSMADLDLDGTMDLVYSCEGASGPLTGLVWLRREGARWAARPLGGAAGKKFDLIAPIDLDADGDLDVLTCEEADNLGVLWYENPTRAAPGFTR